MRIGPSPLSRRIRLWASANRGTASTFQFTLPADEAILMAARFCRARGVVLVAAGCVSLTVLNYFLTPHEATPAGVINQ